MNNQTIRIMFSTSTHPLSSVIRACTWSRWSHVCIVDGDTVIEATATHGVTRTRLFEAVARAKEFAFVDFPCLDAAAVIAQASGQIGKPYDYTAIVGLALHRDWQQDDAWFCSELIAWAFDKAQQPLLRAEILKRVTPQHIWMLPPAINADRDHSPLSLPILNN